MSFTDSVDKVLLAQTIAASWYRRVEWDLTILERTWGSLQRVGGEALESHYAQYLADAIADQEASARTYAEARQAMGIE